MGFFNRLRGLLRPGPAPEPESGTHLAFVLLRQASVPAPEEVIAAFVHFGGAGERLAAGPPAGDDDPRRDDGTYLMTLEGFGTAMIALMPMPIPDGEAEQAVERSLAALSGQAPACEHSAHLVVSLFAGDAGRVPVERLTAFTSLLAAVTRAADSVGVYWGNAGATHDREFFLSTAAAHEVGARLLLWTGISAAREPDGRLSFLSLGMGQLELPNLYLVVPEHAEGPVASFFDLLAYAISRGEPIPDGDTVGFSAEQRLPVRYVPSPAGNGETVWKVELA
jgi:hypothetical protein